MINNIGYVPCIQAISKNDDRLTEKIKVLAANSIDKKLGNIVLKLIEYNDMKLDARLEDESMEPIINVEIFGDELLKEIDKENE